MIRLLLTQIWKKKMNKWIKGLPNHDGLFWFDSGLKSIPQVLQIYGRSKHLFGKSGSIPLDNGHTKLKIKYLPIEVPNIWCKFGSLTENKFWSFVNFNGKIGIGYLEKWGGMYYGHIIYKSGSEDVTFDKHTKCIFHPISRPK